MEAPREEAEQDVISIHGDEGDEEEDVTILGIKRPQANCGTSEEDFPMDDVISIPSEDEDDVVVIGVKRVHLRRPGAPADCKPEQHSHRPLYHDQVGDDCKPSLPDQKPHRPQVGESSLPDQKPHRPLYQDQVGKPWLPDQKPHRPLYHDQVGKPSLPDQKPHRPLYHGQVGETQTPAYKHPDQHRMYRGQGNPAFHPVKQEQMHQPLEQQGQQLHQEQQALSRDQGETQELQQQAVYVQQPQPERSLQREWWWSKYWSRVNQKQAEKQGQKQTEEQEKQDPKKQAEQAEEPEKHPHNVHSQQKRLQVERQRAQHQRQSPEHNLHLHTPQGQKFWGPRDHHHPQAARSHESPQQNPQPQAQSGWTQYWNREWQQNQGQTQPQDQKPGHPQAGGPQERPQNTQPQAQSGPQVAQHEWTQYWNGQWQQNQKNQPQLQDQKPGHPQPSQERPQERRQPSHSEVPKRNVGGHQPLVLPEAAVASVKRDNLVRILQQIAEGDGSEATLEAGLLTVELMKHQKIALAWMEKMEIRDNGCCGGFLADDQGLGKTISIISLILKCGSRKPAANTERADKPAPLKAVISEAKTEARDAGLSTVKPEIPKLPGGTLIVCPLSIIRQWESEIASKVSSPAALSVLVYHGMGRKKLQAEEIAKYDVVLTTYAIVGIEVPMVALEAQGPNDPYASLKKEKTKKVARVFKPGPLSEVSWFRVVLDEAQMIKNSRTLLARACVGIVAERRWCLSGTPVQNTIDDLYSYFRFLRFEPFDKYQTFKQDIKVAIKRSPERGYGMLRAILQAVLLRRTKSTLIDGQPIVSLPPRTVRMEKLDFNPEERSFYESIESQSRKTVQNLEERGVLQKSILHLLVMILRMRQACNHKVLVTSSASQDLGDGKDLSQTSRLELLQVLDAGDFENCALCNDTPEDPVVATCGHVYCKHCVLQELTVFSSGTDEDVTCLFDTCEAELSFSNVFTAEALKWAIAEDDDDDDFEMKSKKKRKKTKEKKSRESRESRKKKLKEAGNPVSSKITAAMKVLYEIQIETQEKTLVFSQWTSMLDLMEPRLIESGIEFVRIDGTMTINDRQCAVDTFNGEKHVRVMLMSLKAASLGLNLVAASRVLMLDPWWNPTTEDQAIDRAHRIGQTRTVQVSKFTVLGTVEDRILELQESKRQMVESTFGEEGAAKPRANRLTLDNLLYLFQ